MNRPVLKLAQARRPRYKKCRAPGCGNEFIVKRIGQKTCSVKCAIAFMRVEQAEKNLRVIRAERQVWRIKNKTLGTLAQETQRELNKWIRWRDRNDGCISCDKPANAPGQWHASHYRSTAAAPELRFDEENIHKSCAKCNDHLSGNLVEYRIRLIEKIGLARVESLEGPHEPKRYRAEDLVQLRKEYVARLREAKSESR